ncbi:MAG: tRNA/rRNA methyltransferase [Chlamydiae bacterium]|nr:tRNA/rRNA methyltransferase [Chlamydiota bacterium]
MKKPFNKEIKYYGIHACLSLGLTRPNDIIKIFIHSSNLKEFRALLKKCSEMKRAYHIVSNEDLDKITGSVHHEGICILGKERLPMPQDQALQAISQLPGNTCLLYMDGVQNPHNIGSILRTCAHFNIPFLLGEKGKLPALSPSACRISKGGSEMVCLVEIENKKSFFAKLKKIGFEIISTSSHVEDSLYSTDLPGRMVLAIGSEADGVSQDLVSISSKKIQIPGSGKVESLNVAVATGLLLGEFHRQHGVSTC